MRIAFQVAAGFFVLLTAAPAELMPAAQQNGLIQKYCAVCHTDAAKNGGLSLQHYDAAAGDPALAAMLLSKLQNGAMGAAGAGVPDKPTQAALDSGHNRASPAGEILERHPQSGSHSYREHRARSPCAGVPNRPACLSLDPCVQCGQTSGRDPACLVARAANRTYLLCVRRRKSRHSPTTGRPRRKNG